MTQPTPQYQREDYGRLPHSLPKELINEIYRKCDRHLPTPKRKTFVELILTMGLDAHENRVALTEPFVGRLKNPAEEVPMDRLHNYLDIEIVNRFNEAHQKHEPPAIVRGFLEYILNLGVQAYEREYTIYGFKKG